MRHRRNNRGDWSPELLSWVGPAIHWSPRL